MRFYCYPAIHPEAGVWVEAETCEKAAIETATAWGASGEYDDYVIVTEDVDGRKRRWLPLVVMTVEEMLA